MFTRTELRLLTGVLILSLCNGLAAKSPRPLGTSVHGADSALSLRLRATLRRPKGDLVAIVLSPDSRFLAPVTKEGKTELWNTQTGQLIATVEGRTFRPYDYSDFRLLEAFSPDSRIFVTTSGKQARLWDAATGRLKHVLSSSDEMASTAFSPDGKTIATGGKYGTVSLWNAETGQSNLTLDAYSVEKYPRWRIISRTFQTSTDVQVHFSPDGRRLLTILYGQPAKLWNVATGRNEAVLGQEISNAKFSPGGRYLLTRSLAGTDLWDAESGRKRAHFTSWDTEFSPDEHWLGLVEYEGTTGLLNLKTMKVEVPLRLVENNFSSWIAFSPNGKVFVLASGLNDHSAALVDVSTGKPIADVPIVAKRGFDLISDFLKYTETLAFHPSSRILMGANQELVRFWDTKVGQQITQLPEGRGPAIFSSDGKLLATAGQDKKSVLLWDVSVQ